MQRNSNIELLRIVAMVIIVMHHFAVHSHFVFDTDIISFNRVFIQFMLLGGKLGVDIFVIISGYFLIRKEFSLLKITKLIGHVWLYTLCIVGVALYFNYPVDDVKKYFIPIYSVNWFAYVYMILYLLFPFINVMLKSLDRLKHLKLILIMNLMWCVLNWLFTAPMQYSNIVWFVNLYSIGAFFCLYGIPKWKHGRNIVLGIVAITLAIAFFDIGGLYFHELADRWSCLYAQNSPFILWLAVCIFLYFKELSIPYNKVVNTVAATTFGIYLIHDNPITRSYIWTKFFNNPQYTDRSELWFYAIGEVVLIFTVCSLIDYIRLMVVSASLSKAVVPYVNYVQDKGNKLICNLDKWLYKS